MRLERDWFVRKVGMSDVEVNLNVRRFRVVWVTPDWLDRDSLRSKSPTKDGIGNATSSPLKSDLVALGFHPKTPLVTAFIFRGSSCQILSIMAMQRRPHWSFIGSLVKTSDMITSSLRGQSQRPSTYLPLHPRCLSRQSSYFPIQVTLSACVASNHCSGLILPVISPTCA